jgi:hypothetical protein
MLTQSSCPNGLSDWWSDNKKEINSQPVLILSSISFSVFWVLHFLHSSSFHPRTYITRQASLNTGASLNPFGASLRTHVTMQKLILNCSFFTSFFNFQMYRMKHLRLYSVTVSTCSQGVVDRGNGCLPYCRYDRIPHWEGFPRTSEATCHIRHPPNVSRNTYDMTRWIAPMSSGRHSKAGPRGKAQPGASLWRTTTDSWSTMTHHDCSSPVHFIMKEPIFASKVKFCLYLTKYHAMKTYGEWRYSSTHSQLRH